MKLIDFSDPGDSAMCAAPGSCTNAARYFEHSYAETWVLRYCGIHDIEFNNGEGKLRRELEIDE